MENVTGLEIKIQCQISLKKKKLGKLAKTGRIATGARGAPRRPFLMLNTVKKNNKKKLGKKSTQSENWRTSIKFFFSFDFFLKILLF